MVGLTKARAVLPVSLQVVKLSGSGQDSVFMGLVRPVGGGDQSRVRLWVSPMGTVLCAEEHFGDMFGVAAAELVGRPFSSLGVDPVALDR